MLMLDKIFIKDLNLTAAFITVKDLQLRSM